MTDGIEKLHQIPEKWVWTTVEDIGVVASGSTPSTKEPDFWGGEISWITPADLTGYKEKFIGKGARNITKKGLDSCSTRLMPKGTILYSSRAPIGYAAIAKNPIATNQGFKNLIISEGIFNEYVYHYLKGNKQLAESYGSGTTFKELSASRFRKIPVPIPPTREQHCIVCKFEELFTRLDAGVESLQNVKAQLQLYRQAVLKHAFNGKLTQDWRKKNKDQLELSQNYLQLIKQQRRHGWEENLRKLNRDPRKCKYNEALSYNAKNLPSLPTEWTYASVDELSVQITDGEHITPKRVKKGIYLLSARNVSDGQLLLEDVDYIPESEYERINRRLKPEAGDVLLTCSGSVGRTCVVPEELVFQMVRSVAIIKPIRKFVNGKYLSFALRSHILQSQINTKKSQTAQSNIFQGKIKTLAFPLASLPEQLEIVEKIESYFSVADKIEKIIEESLLQSMMLRQSVLKTAFEGKLVTQDHDDEPAVILLERIRREKEKRQLSKKKQKNRKQRRLNRYVE